MKTQKTVFYCKDCGNETAKWSGRCAACGEWNTLVEAPAEVNPRSGGASARASFNRRSGLGGGDGSAAPKRLSELDGGEELRFTTGIAEFDRVLGGGAVRGSVVLVGGAPGIGKSTLLLQLCGTAFGGRGEASGADADDGARILYVTGEESEKQLKMRAERLGVHSDNLYILAETDIEATEAAVDAASPQILIADSIQTLYSPALDTAPGSVTQVRECAMSLIRMCKPRGITVFVVGHINKDGGIAGPKVLEHMVDCVLYFEGERVSGHRIVRAAKNRFGSTNEIGVFEMTENGLRDVQNPSELLLSGRPINAPGTCVTCVMEGSRPILAEIQALVSKSAAAVPRRNANGIDYNRAMLLLAVLEKRGGYNVGGCDAYINVIGGLELDDPATDLAAVLAITSSGLDKPLGGDLAAVGELGLAGELRSVAELNSRLAEIGRLGFKRCIVPAHAGSEVKPVPGLKILRAANISEAIGKAFGS